MPSIDDLREVPNESAFDEDAESIHPNPQSIYGPVEVNDQVFEELRLEPMVVAEVQRVWKLFLASAESPEAAGEAIYAAMFDASPSLQSLFKTPRAVMAMRFMNGLNQIVNALHDPTALKVVVETYGFQHLDLEVTIPRVVIFREALQELLTLEMGSRFTAHAKEGFATFMNYVGGAYIYVRAKFSERLKILSSSWAMVTNRLDEEIDEPTSRDGESHETATDIAPPSPAMGKKHKGSLTKSLTKSLQSSLNMSQRGFQSHSAVRGHADTEPASNNGDSSQDFRNTAVPTTFHEMFMFNAAVMGFGNQAWMNEVLASFDCIVSNVANSYRLQEECDVLCLRIAKYNNRGQINLADYKAVMLASLRSLCKEWGSQHETAWSWLWQNVERMIKALMGKPAGQQKALAALFSSLDEAQMSMVRREVYAKFFAVAPAGQDYFKQSTTRLHFIADKLVAMTLDMYREPQRMVEDISALGLRHVGYGIPTDLFNPFVTACVQVFRLLTSDDAAEEAFRWSLNLISRILTRVINEGSTIVMKAINANSGKLLKKAVSCAPRGKRALWMLNIQVGTQSISPLMWAIETGSLEAANAIIVDLLTIRADRDRYYFGMDILFERHPDIIKRLCVDAPALLPTLLDCLVWRSRTTENGLRRVNYYIRHLLMDENGDFSKATEWLTDNKDPKLVCHPVVAMVTDMVWARIAFRTFIKSRAWFLFTLIVFITSQTILKNSKRTADVRALIFVLRCFIYLCSMGQWIFFHVKNTVRDLRNGSVYRYGRMKIPEYLGEFQGGASLVLTVLLVAMLVMEPILHCLGDSSGALFTERCAAGEDLGFAYSVASMGAMLMYFLLLSDLSVFSTRVSAFALVCSRVLSEVALFLFGMCFFVAAFACAISALQHENPLFLGIADAALNLGKITFGMFSGQNFIELANFPALLAAIFVYVVVTVIFMLNLLIAQLNCAYQATYLDMVGYARLNRGKIVCETMPSVARSRWESFVEDLHLDECCEYGEGDVGVPGGVQVWEPAAANITTVDMIRRFGGTTSPAAQWPEEEGLKGDDDEDRFDKMEKLVEKALRRATRGTQPGTSPAGTNQDLDALQDSAGSIGSVAED